VIVPAFTWISTANVVEYMGARPVFSDIDLATFNSDPAMLERVVSERTVGIIPVHLFGLGADIEAILAFAERHRLWVLEDAACGFGAWYEGRHAGTFGTIGAFSFHPRKSNTTGEAGILTTADPELVDLARSLRDHGASRSDLARRTERDSFLLAEYDHLGYNFRMTDIQAAFGCAQMHRVDWILERRREAARLYDELLADVEWLQSPVVPPEYVLGYHAYVFLFRSEEPTRESVDELHRQRNEVMRLLEDNGIATRQGTHAPIAVGYYARRYGLRSEQIPNAFVANRLSLALPLYAQLTAENQETVVGALARGFQRA
jgi:perosamine synthetase